MLPQPHLAVLDEDKSSLNLEKPLGVLPDAESGRMVVARVRVGCRAGEESRQQQGEQAERFPHEMLSP